MSEHAREDAEIFNAITRTINEANRLFFGPFAPMPNEQGSARRAWEARHAELTRAQDILWDRHVGRAHHHNKE
jgi:hypothetical protein